VGPPKEIIMKNRSILLAGAAAMGLAPFLVHAAESDSIQRCMDSFASQNFPNSRIAYVVNDGGRPLMPLIAQTGTQSVELIATSRADGRVLGKATCQVRESGNREGEVIVTPIDNE
jgi:hypothetical protein